MSKKCPCCSGKSYGECCRKFHKGHLPTNAEQLMRSRYSAYAYQIPLYIIHTTHPQNPHFRPDKNAWMRDILTFCRDTKFESLDVLEFTDGAIEAFVTFHAHLSQSGKNTSFIERSRFLKEEGKWLYVEGIFHETNPK